VADLDALARELVEAGMQWLPGMLYWIGERDDRYWDRVQDAEAEDWGPPDAAYPDLTDWPTIGALLGELSRRHKGASLREAHGLWTATWWEPDAICYETASTPGEAVGRALLAVLRAERGTS